MFFENLDEPAAYNPLTKGVVKSLTTCSAQMVSTFDVGVAAAAMVKSPEEWAGKTLECASYKGTIAEVAAALQKVSGVPTKASLAMPICLRSLFLNDLHHMCVFFEGESRRRFLVVVAATATAATHAHSNADPQSLSPAASYCLFPQTDTRARASTLPSSTPSWPRRTRSRWTRRRGSGTTSSLPTARPSRRPECCSGAAERHGGRA